MKNPHLSKESTLIYLPSPDGHRIPLRHWPVASPRAVIHCVHGMAEHSGNYADLAEFFNRHGFSVVAHDHRCHGLSVQKEEELGATDSVENWPGLLPDMLLINNWLRATYAGLPVIVIGHSMGSFVSQWFAQHYPDRVNVLALAGSDYLPPWFTRISSRVACLECWRGGRNGRSDVIHGLGFGKFNQAFHPARTEFDWLSRDEAFVDRYVADPLCGFRMANGYWMDMLRTLAEIYTPSNVARLSPGLPVYVVAGDRDPVGHMGKGVKRLARLLEKRGHAKVTLALYPGARHDILHETNADEVRGKLLDWINTHLPA